MPATRFFDTKNQRRIAYHASAGSSDWPGVVFFGGFKSDMQGSKALHLETWAQAQGRAFLRFDYSGHGESSGDFTDGCIGDWYQDALDIISAKTTGKQIFVGSSMGGWIALLVARKLPTRVAGLVGIASAPDFTEDSMWTGFDAQQKQELADKGQVALPSDYGDPYIITQKLIKDGRNHLVLRDPLPLPFPTRFLQGTDDNDVDQSVALRLLGHASGDNIQLTLVKGADHRFSTAECLNLITCAIDQVSA